MRIDLMSGLVARMLMLFVVALSMLACSEAQAQNPVGPYWYTYDIQRENVRVAQQNHADVVEDWNEAVGLYASAYYTAKLDYFDMAAMFVIQWNFMLPAATPTSDVSNGLSYLDSLLDAGTGEPALAYDVSAAASSLASADAAFKAAMMAADGAGGYPSVAQMAACETTESSFLSAVDAYEDATEEYEDWLKRQPLGSSYGVVLSNSDRFTSLINWLQTAYAMLAGYPD